MLEPAVCTSRLTCFQRLEHYALVLADMHHPAVHLRSRFMAQLMKPC